MVSLHTAIVTRFPTHTGRLFVILVILRQFISDMFNKSCLFTFSYAQPDEGYLE